MISLIYKHFKPMIDMLDTMPLGLDGHFDIKLRSELYPASVVINPSLLWYSDKFEKPYELPMLGFCYDSATPINDDEAYKIAIHIMANLFHNLFSEEKSWAGLVSEIEKLEKEGTKKARLQAEENAFIGIRAHDNKQGTSRRS